MYEALRKDYETQLTNHEKDFKSMYDLLKVKHEAELTKVHEKHNDAESRCGSLKVMYDVELTVVQEKHNTTKKSLEVGIHKERDEAQAKHKLLENKHAVDLKQLQGVNVQQIGKIKKRDREHETKVKRATLLKDVAKTKVANAVITTSKVEMLAETLAKQHKKTKRKATNEIRADEKKQKANELLQMTKYFVNLQH